MAELWREAGLPDGVLNIVHGGQETVEAICDHPGVEGISFVHFDERDVVRHSLVQRIVKAYEKHNETIGAGRQLSLRLSDPAIDAAPDGLDAPSPDSVSPRA